MKPFCIPALFGLMVLSSTNLTFADNDPATGIKEMQGISIKADKEAPKSLVIGPWHDALERLDDLERNRPRASHAITRQLQHAANQCRLALHVALARRSPDPSPHSRVIADLAPYVVSEQRRVWCEDSRLGGLEERLVVRRRRDQQHVPLDAHEQDVARGVEGAADLVEANPHNLAADNFRQNLDARRSSLEFCLDCSTA